MTPYAMEFLRRWSTHVPLILILSFVRSRIGGFFDVSDLLGHKEDSRAELDFKTLGGMGGFARLSPIKCHDGFYRGHPADPPNPPNGRECARANKNARPGDDCG